MSTTSSPTSLTRYRAEIGRTAPLAPEAERDLARRYQAGDREAARLLIESCLPAVVRIASRYRRWGAPLEDLVQEGNVGLLKALDRFDPSHGVRLAAYAQYWIRAEIREYVARHYRIVRLGSSKSERRALHLFRRTREQRPEVLAAMSGLTEERATELLPLLLSRETRLVPDDDGMNPLERLAGRDPSAEDALGDAEERARLRGALREAVAGLSAREQDIIKKRLLSDEPATLEQLGDAWGVSRERVRQIEERAKERMRARLAELDGGAGYAVGA
jgi:RNA polymerase sigma-32 factor